MIGPPLERDAYNPYALCHVPQATAEPLISKLAAGVALFFAATVFAWIGCSL